MSFIKIFKPILFKKSLNTVCICAFNPNRFISQKVSDLRQTEQNTQQAQKKKTVPVPKITLISDDKTFVTTLQEAEKLSRRRNLKLAIINDLDAKTNRPIYKLITGKEFYEIDLKNREEKRKQKLNSFIKGEKNLIIGESISEHDLSVQIKKVEKWLTKSCQVNAVINSNSEDMSKCENIYKNIEESLKTNGRLLQKRTKGNTLRFQIIPVKKKDSDSPKDDSDLKKGHDDPSQSS